MAAPKGGKKVIRRRREKKNVERGQVRIDRASNRRADVHDVAETLDVHQLHDLDAAGQADLA